MHSKVSTICELNLLLVYADGFNHIVNHVVGTRGDGDKSNRNSKIGLDCRPINENDSVSILINFLRRCCYPFSNDPKIPNSPKKTPKFQK